MRYASGRASLGASFFRSIGDVLPEDRAAVDAFNLSAKPDRTLRLEHLPEPFLGRPEAPVVMLNLNPRHNSDDDPWHTNSVFAARSRANLVHGELEYPFYLLDPGQKSLGHFWWSQKPRKLIDATSREKVARHVLCVELFGHHSERCGMGHRFRPPSQAYSLHLVRSAIARGAWIVRMRSERAWFGAVPDLAKYERLLRVRNVQTPAISPRNLGEPFDSLVGAVLRA